MKSVMTSQQHFAKVASPKIQRSTFDRSHGFKATFDAGKIIPIFVDEALPGDTFNLKTTIFGRLNTPLKPIMDNIYVDVHFFSIPERLLWDNWQKMNGEQTDPGDSTTFIMPTMTSPAGGYLEGSLQDYMGIPTKIQGIEHRADFLRAYNLVYNSWYRDENLQNSVKVDVDNGPDTVTDYILLPRGKRKDYFSSALTSAQKALPVSIPLGTFAPVVTKNEDILFNNLTDTTDRKFRTVADANPGLRTTLDGNPTGDNFARFGATTGLQTDLSTATAITINSLREASQIQIMYEKDARGGTRYIELLQAHFGVTSPDARLQRPEFLGGFTAPINVSPVAQTQATEAGNTPQGNLAAMGTFHKSQKGFIKSFVEHEIILGFISARADLNYQQGLNRMWSRSTRFDFYWPSFAHLGEQAILNKEIYTQGVGDPTADAATFGYQERYAEYRYKPSLVTGLFRSNATGTLDIWHLAQKFTALPALNAAYIVESPPIDRVVAVTTEPDFMLDVYFDLKCARPMPTYATPGALVSL